MPTPEALARQNIDRLIETAGWAVQDREALNLGASMDVAACEFPKLAGPADYLLFAGRIMIAVVELKATGTTPKGRCRAVRQVQRERVLRGHAWRRLRHFSYEGPISGFSLPCGE